MKPSSSTMKSPSTKSARKTPRHAIRGLLAQPTPGISSSILSKSYSNREDLQVSGQLKAAQRKLLRHRRSEGLDLAGSNKAYDLQVMDFEDDTETPRTRIEAFLQNADTDSPAEMSTRQLSGRAKAFSFTRTPSKLISTPSKLAKEESSLSLPSPGIAFTPRANIEHFLQGSGSEKVPRTRSVISRSAKSETKTVSAQRSKNWAQRVSASPMYHTDIGDAADESNPSASGNFKSLRPRRSFHIRDPASQATPAADRSKDLRLSMSDSKAKFGSRSMAWAQRASTSPMNRSDGGKTLEDSSNSNSPRRFFRYQRRQRSFHIPDPPIFHAPEEGSQEKVSVSGAEKADDEQYQDDGNDEAKPGRKDVLLESGTPFDKDSIFREVKDKLKIYDLSDGSSDLDFTPNQSVKGQSNEDAAFGSGVRSMSKTPMSRDSATVKRSSSRSSSNRKRSLSTSKSSTLQSARRTSPRLGSPSHDSALSSTQHRLSWINVETNNFPLPPPSKKARSSLESIHIPSAPPSSTPLKRHKSSIGVNVVEISGSAFSRKKNVDEEVISVLANATLPGLSPIRAVEEGDREKDKDEDVEEQDLSDGLPLLEMEQNQENVLQEIPAGTSSNKEPESDEATEYESPSNSLAMETPKIDMNKKPRSLSAKKLHLLTPLREDQDKPGPSRGKRKASVRKGVAKKNPEDDSFVSRKMVKFYAERFSTLKMDKEVIDELMKASNTLWKENLETADGYARHAGRKSITKDDIVLLMKIQRLITGTEHLYDLIREHLPMGIRCELIPCARPHFPTKSQKKNESDDE